MEAWREELYHFNIPGSHWYQRRFQNYDGSLTPEGRKRYGVGDPRVKKSFKERRLEKERAKKRTEALAKARKAKAAKAEEAKKKAEMEANKAKVLASGSAKEVLQYQGQITNAELSNALNRIQWERQLASISAEEEKSNWDKMDKFMNKVGKVTNYIDTGTKFYNSVAKVINATGLTEDKLPVVGGGGGDDQKKKKK